MKSYIFIIPLTPPSYLNDTRVYLQKLCFQTLLKQSWNNWHALVIGAPPSYLPDDERFIKIDFEGTKEEKLQTASEYILSSNLPGDYIIRLDDDDIFNPEILSKINNIEFDVYSDLYQSFVHFDSGKIAQSIWYWLPNTCIHKREHAFTTWGEYEPRPFKRFRDRPYLIENDHSKIHHYYKKLKVVYSQKQCPVYLRVISDVTVTARNYSSHTKVQFLNRFGWWHSNNLRDFQIINFNQKQTLNQSIFVLIINCIKNKIHYLKIIKSQL
jgi:hypothetical protein